MKNLPIKSPKVPTLKKALRRFHQSQRNKNSKPLAAKLLVEASLKEENEKKEGTVGRVTFFNQLALKREPDQIRDQFKPCVSKLITGM